VAPITPQFKITLTDDEHAILNAYMQAHGYKSKAAAARNLMAERLAELGYDFPPAPTHGGKREKKRQDE
jgi:hypothetical protein